MEQYTSKFGIFTILIILIAKTNDCKCVQFKSDFVKNIHTQDYHWHALNVGDECFVHRTGERGICEYISQCKSLEEEMQICGYSQHSQTVCCPRRTIKLESIATKMCFKYRNEVIKRKTVFTLFNEKQIEKNEQCMLKISSFIVDGDQARQKEFPHMATIGFGEPDNIQYFCGGSLISDYFIVSAAHCRNAPGLGQAKYVRLGSINLKNTDKEHFSIYIITDVIVHPDYKYPSTYNDIALMKVDTAVKFNSHIYPICLPPSNYNLSVNKKVLATGFGAIGFAEPMSDKLLKTTLDVFSSEECRQLYKFDEGKKLSNGVREEMQFCAGSRNGEKDTCQGDSGGPLQIFNKEVDCTYTLIGITSFGKGCGIAGSAGVYTRVSFYVDWITKNIWPEL